jgi:hypothetical protein
VASTKLAYLPAPPSAPTAITITLASLAATSARESNTVDNTTNLLLDALVRLRVKVDTTAPANDKAVYVYAWGIIDSSATPAATAYPDAVTGSDAAITLQSPTQLRLIGVLNTPSASTTYKSEPLSVAGAFGGSLPPKWGIVVSNSSAVLTAVAGDHALEYVGVYSTTA